MRARGDNALCFELGAGASVIRSAPSVVNLHNLHNQLALGLLWIVGRVGAGVGVGLLGVSHDGSK
jgi:hypothetical protein